VLEDKRLQEFLRSALAIRSNLFYIARMLWRVRNSRGRPMSACRFHSSVSANRRQATAYWTGRVSEHSLSQVFWGNDR